MMQNLRLDSKGLTLIEIMIAMALLSLLSVFVYNATTRGFEVNRNLSSESNDYLAIAVSLDTLEADLSQFYSPATPEPINPNNTNPALNTNPTSTETSPSQFWSIPIGADGLRRSRFVGTKDKITFVSNGHHRIQKDARESDFIKVTWEIVQNKTGAYSLQRSIDTDAFNITDRTSATDKGGERTILIDNVGSGKFTFYRKEKDAWDDAWDSEGSYVKADLRYPQLISLKLEVPDPINPAKMRQWEGLFRPNLNFNEAPPPQALPKDPNHP
jgi:prepilin-type N-terminal cleavage/methylation domain-containing protein